MKILDEEELLQLLLAANIANKTYREFSVESIKIIGTFEEITSDILTDLKTLSKEKYIRKDQLKRLIQRLEVRIQRTFEQLIAERKKIEKLEE